MDDLDGVDPRVLREEPEPIEYDDEEGALHDVDVYMKHYEDRDE